MKPQHFSERFARVPVAQSTTLLANVRIRYIGEAGHKTPKFLASDQIKVGDSCCRNGRSSGSLQSKLSASELLLSSQIPRSGYRLRVSPNHKNTLENSCKKSFIWTIREMYPKVMMSNLDAALENFIQENLIDYNFSGAE